MKVIFKLNILKDCRSIQFAGSLGIAPTFLKLDSFSPGAGFNPIISTKGINRIRERKKFKKKVKFYASKEI